MNLTNVANLAKKILIPALISTTVIVLIFLITLRYQAPQEKAPISTTPLEEPSLVQPPLIEKPTSLNVSADLLKSPDKPNPTLVYEIQEPSFTPTDASRIAASLQLSGQPEILQDALLGETFRWSTPQATLSVNRFRLIFNKQPSDSLRQTPRFNTLEDVESHIKAFFQELGLQSDSFTLIFDNVNFLKKRPTGEIERTSNIADADTISILLAFKLNGATLVDHNADQTPASLTVTKAGEVTSLTYRLLPQPQPLARFPLKTVAEAARDVLQGQGTTVDFISGKVAADQYLDPLKINSASLSTATLSYYWPLPSPQILQPVYVFRGNAQTADGEEGEVAIIIPAIRKEYFNQP